MIGSIAVTLSPSLEAPVDAPALNHQRAIPSLSYPPPTSCGLGALISAEE